MDIFDSGVYVILTLYMLLLQSNESVDVILRQPNSCDMEIVLP